MGSVWCGVCGEVLSGVWSGVCCGVVYVVEWCMLWWCVEWCMLWSSVVNKNAKKNFFFGYMLKNLGHFCSKRLTSSELFKT